MYPAYNNQFYMQDLQNTRDRIDRQIQQAQQMQQMQQNMQTQSSPPITQNFQIAPTQSLNGIKYANSIDEVKRELVFGDTIFVNKEYSRMWLKNARGDTKEYTMVEVIELDPKDAEIEDLKAQIRALKEGGQVDTGYVDKPVTEPSKKSKSSGVSNANGSKA